jgi:hypothetical protein
MNLLRSLIDSFFAARRRAYDTPAVPDAWLKPFVVLLIALWCGPEVFAAIELTSLLELLGATLFLLAFTTSFKLLALSMLDWLRRVFLPSECTALISMRRWPSAVALGLCLILLNGLVLFIVCLTPFMIVSNLLGSA